MTASYIETKIKLSEYIADFDKFYNIDNKGVHNFTFGCLDCYFYINDQLQSDKPPLFLKNDILVIYNKQGKFITFIYKPIKDVPIEIIKHLQILGTIYSIFKIDELEQKVECIEITYDLEKIFNPASYPNAKKRHQRIVYPFKQLEKWNVICSSITSDNIKEARDLHTIWVKDKLNNPKTYKIMFPNRRYINCCEKSISANSPYKSYLVYYEHKPVFARVLFVQEEKAFDMAFFGDIVKLPSQFANYIDTYILKDLFDSGIKTVNCGFEFNKSLSNFKKHFPSETVKYWRYSKLKNSTSEKLNNDLF